jgi:hypothetical protein
MKSKKREFVVAIGQPTHAPLTDVGLSASVEYYHMNWLRWSLAPPEVLEPHRRQFCVPHGVLNVSVTKVRLQRPGIVPLVGQRVTTGVPEHVRERFEGQLSFPPRIGWVLGVPCLTRRTCRVPVLNSTWSQRRSTNSETRRPCR